MKKFFYERTKKKQKISAQSGNTLLSEDEIAKMNNQMLKQKLLEICETDRPNESEAVSKTSNMINKQSCLPTKLNLDVSPIEKLVEVQDKNRHINIEIASLICNDVNDQLELKKQLSIFDEHIKKLTKLLEHKGPQVMTDQKHQDKGDVKLGYKSDFGVHATKQILIEQPFVVQLRNDVRTDNDIRHLDHDVMKLAMNNPITFAKYQIHDKFCKKYVVSQCLSRDVQEIALADNNNTFNLLMSLMYKIFGCKHYIQERTSELLQFSTSHNE
ncbi:hypothetical protein RFI_03417 [Reticulomyxa filosa]|uniref:Uncharacterized protein n=1 Tax=Reticulomyxa filosa TaxID=46433 RepID=X6P7S6_RETFI|nr:hypothetical protein RFI_03417 [Reticulomyxa filosa]|eukprot:ETO33687.1 hypothetical protein RFI_03417 [Reticulomyxa filosa]